ncbi:uncharacterized protein LOC131636971 [Vicia villosa]|uniref:uncharacterized protein LOC131636971 n=1 Tax=Vicia villosa TaxID=3911 RepID=UPI00273CBAC3|nr:uncharacterized protein LOC131636971 [Vicia villosa]XP_058763527.1 uncharacterized protein LOC131636971 [Vicia villosa]XP_058763528.1 uncharacterized protein LOC131636971 [Vicia villosa]XP_058763529.1 uncharacterized protein LOC131636971 [Vicia villosa]XP_058763530.1 uncharacterized protein LOC131636971 [Vicia villosa]
MASANQNPVFRDGGSNNKPPLFCGEYFDFWKIQMKAHLEAKGEEVWEAVIQGPHVPITVVNGVGSEKPKASWDDNDRKRVLADKKAISLLHGALSMDEFFRISTCTTSKEIWDTLVETHEGTAEVKRSRLNTLSQEYELFRMKPGETILDLQKRFVHLTNHLKALGKTLTAEELNLKVLRSLTREWQPKVTAISEKKNLSKLTSATLFGKLQEYETELGRLEKHENLEKKSKGIALKVDSIESKMKDASDEDENFLLLVKRLGKFFGNKNNIDNTNYVKRKKFSKHKDKEASTSSQEVTCYECGKQGHIKPECPKLSKKNVFKGKREFKNKKAYIAWEDNEVSSSSDSDSDESANLALMASHHSDDEEGEVSYDDSLFDNGAQGAIEELLKECKILYKTISSQKKIISSLEEKVKIIEVEHKDDKEKMISVQEDNVACKNCESLSFQIVQLKRVLERYEKGQIGLENVLSTQRYSNDKSGLGFSKFDKPTSNKTIFVKASNQPIQEKVIKPKVMQHYPKRKNFVKKKSYPPRYRSNFEPTCFYCGIIGHTPNACYVRNFSVPSRHYVWVKKGTNYDGPKAIWVPNKT